MTKHSKKKRSIRRGEQAQAGNLVVFGIRPTAPKTGYGYLEANKRGDDPQPLELCRKSRTAHRLSNTLPKAAIIGIRACFASLAGVMAEKYRISRGKVSGRHLEWAFAKARQEASVMRFEEEHSWPSRISRSTMR